MLLVIKNEFCSIIHSTMKGAVLHNEHFYFLVFLDNDISTFSRVKDLNGSSTIAVYLQQW